MAKITKKLIKSYLRDKLANSDKWALHCLEVIYDNQTPLEKGLENTREENGIGFTGVDGEILSSFAKQYLNRGSLSEKQMVIVRKKAPKYWKQVLELCDHKLLLKCMIRDGVVDKK